MSEIKATENFYYYGSKFSLLGTGNGHARSQIKKPQLDYRIDPIDYVTGIGNAHSNQYKIFAHSALWCWSSSPRSELENSVSWTAEVRLS